MTDNRARQQDDAVVMEDGMNPAPESPGEGEFPVDGSQWRSWGNLWQIPTIIISALLILSGVVIGIKKKPPLDIDLALQHTEQFIADNQFDQARIQLQEVIEPKLTEASDLEQAHFHAVTADWIYFAQAEERQKSIANNQRINQQYTQAVELGMMLQPPRLERWAESLIDAGQLDQARDVLAQLDAIDLTSGPEGDVRDRRNRIRRQLIEHSLEAEDIESDAMLALLQEYEQDDRLAPEDRAWAIARRAAIRLDAGSTRVAIDRLLVDMRRLETQVVESDGVNFGELYALLGRGYYDLGQYGMAGTHLTEALGRLSENDPVRGDVLVLQGKIAMVETDYEEAFELFDEVVRTFVSTHSYLPGLLGRAEVSSVLGNHDGSRSDYRTLRERLVPSPLREDVNTLQIAESLCDRHDAALASRQLELALDYARIAELFFTKRDLPAGIMLRIASTSRALGDRIVDSLARGSDGRSRDDQEADLERLREANEHYERAGDYHIMHARSMAMLADSDDSWAQSLWLGADAYDLGGWYDLAIGHFQEYLGGRSTSDPRRAEALFRLGRANQAQLNHETAAKSYEEVIANHPRSQFASSSCVPLAKCYIALGRTSEAEEHLLQVVSGQRFLEPEAQDYRLALLELGHLYHSTKQYVKAIETLSLAVKRYPDDTSRCETLFELAESYRSHAMEIERELQEATRMAPSERARLDQMKREHFRQGIRNYTAVCEGLESGLNPALNRFDRELQRRSYLYQADCRFHLGEFQAAIEMYDFVARKYGLHHSSMYALVQIVNCYTELGQLDRAQTAHRRALVRLEQLSPDTFDAPDSLMNRDAWERWLENSPVAPGRTAGISP